MRNLSEKMAEFVSTHPHLQFAYISHLAIEDITSFVVGKPELERLDKWASEKELAFFEKHEAAEDPIFPDKRITEVFPKYAAPTRALMTMNGVAEQPPTSKTRQH